MENREEKASVGGKKNDVKAFRRGAISGMVNMENDEKLLQDCEEKKGEDFLAISVYRFATPTITMGFTQKAVDIFDMNKIVHYGVNTVNRKTGGKALLHQNDLCYSVVCNFSHPVYGGSLLESYEKIARSIRFFLVNLGIKGVVVQKQTEAIREQAENEDLQNPSQNKHRNVLCYAMEGFMEIAVEKDGQKKKLVGSAQKRGKYGYLQHGSIPIYPGNFKIENFLLHPNPVAVSSTSISECLSQSELDIPMLENKLLAAFVQKLR